MTFDDIEGQETAVAEVRELLKTNSFEKPLLLYGPTGTGKTTIARLIGKSRVCERPQDGGPCGTCYACRKFERAPDAATYQYIDCVRLGGAASARMLADRLTASGIAEIVVVLDEAQELTARAQATLLISLEQLAANVVCVICTSEVARLKRNFRTRCHEVELQRADDELLASRASRQKGRALSPAERQFLVKKAEGSFRKADELTPKLEALMKAQDVVGVIADQYILGVINRVPIETQLETYLEWSFDPEEKARVILRRLDEMIVQSLLRDPLSEEQAGERLAAAEFIRRLSTSEDRSALVDIMRHWRRVHDSGAGAAESVLFFDSLVGRIADAPQTTARPRAALGRVPKALKPRREEQRLTQRSIEALWDSASVFAQRYGLALTLQVTIRVKEPAAQHVERTVLSSLTHRASAFVGRRTSTPAFWIYVREREGDQAVSRLAFALDIEIAEQLSAWISSRFVSGELGKHIDIKIEVEAKLPHGNGTMKAHYRTLSWLLGAIDPELRVQFGPRSSTPLSELLRVHPLRHAGIIEGRRWGVSDNASALAKEEAFWRPFHTQAWNLILSGKELEIFAQRQIRMQRRHSREE